MLRLFLDSLRTALRAMAQKPLRTFLVLQGMVWGTAVAIMPPAIIEGSRLAMLREAGRVGTDRVVVTSDALGENSALTLEDVRFLRERFGASISAIAPFRTRKASFRAEGRTVSGFAVGTTEEAGTVLGRSLATGRMFGEDAGETVLDSSVAGELGLPPGDGPEGPGVEIAPEADPSRRPGGAAEPGAATLRVVGRLAAPPAEQAAIDDFGFKRRHILSGFAAEAMKNMGVLDGAEDWRASGRCAFVPLSRLPAEDGRVDMIVLRAKPEGLMRFLGDLQRSLSERGRAPLVRWNVLAPVLLEGRMDQYIRLRYATFLLCLVMGAIVISNVMLFSVLENVREIAIRRVEGATSADIVLQHLFHASILATAGGLLGIPAGLAVAWVRIQFAPQAAMGIAMPWGSAALAVGCTVLAGILAGVLPARRAAALDPVEALRNE
jgi:putative ABC transport system permease protein